MRSGDPGPRSPRARGGRAAVRAPLDGGVHRPADDRERGLEPWDPRLGATAAPRDPAAHALPDREPEDGTPGVETPQPCRHEADQPPEQPPDPRAPGEVRGGDLR